jgi:hypothetical protein
MQKRQRSAYVEFEQLIQEFQAMKESERITQLPATPDRQETAPASR